MNKVRQNLYRMGATGLMVLAGGYASAQAGVRVDTLTVTPATVTPAVYRAFATDVPYPNLGYFYY